MQYKLVFEIKLLEGGEDEVVMIATINPDAEPSSDKLVSTDEAQLRSVIRERLEHMAVYGYTKIHGDGFTQIPPYRIHSIVAMTPKAGAESLPVEAKASISSKIKAFPGSH